MKEKSRSAEIQVNDPVAGKNEELITVNHELKDKVDEISRSNSDLQNLMDATDIITFFLDRALKIKFFTPNAQTLFNIIPSDLGRPLEHLTHKLDYGQLTEDAAQVLRTLRPFERETRDTSGRHYLARLVPYRTLEDRLDGVVLSFVEVTELKRASEALRESEERFFSVINQVTALMARTDLEGKFLLVNDRFCEMTGYSREELLKLRMQDITHEKDLQENNKLFERAVTEGTPFVIEKRYIRKDGSPVWVHNSISAITGDDGKPQFILAISLDVSESRQLPESLHRSEVQFRDLLENLPAAAYTCNPEGLITYFNSRAAELWGREPKLFDPSDKFCGSFKLFTPDGTPIPHNLCWMALTLKDDKPYDDYEIVIERPDGSRLTVLAHANPIHDTAGNLTGAVNVLVDITERKRMEKARAHLAAIVESSDDAIISKDLQSTITSWNKGAEKLFGYTTEEAIGKSVTMLIPAERIDEEPQILASIRRGETIDHYETVRRRKDGTSVDVSLTVSPIRDEAGKIIGASKIGRDISRRIQVENMLRESDRRKDEFLATLAHELRNPLAAIGPALEVLRRGNQEKGAAARQVIERQLGQIVRLVDDLLDIARITQGKIKLQLERVELSNIIEMTLETIRPLADAARHELIVTLPAEPLYLDADLTRLTQIFLNLLTNSVRYTEPGGKIWLTAQREEEQIVVRITDTGLGIAPEMLPHVFELFTQSERAGQSAQGLGIGLSLVKQLAEMHSGTVEAHSAGAGQGSEFVVRLPLATQQSAPPPATAEQPAARQTARHILVVDDNTDSAEMLKVILTMEGHEVRLAYDGATAIKVALEYQPDLMFLDLGLPDLHGCEVAAQLRPQLPHTLLVALSGWGQESDRRSTKEAGFDFHLVKPLDFKRLPELLAIAGTNRTTNLDQ